MRRFLWGAAAKEAHARGDLSATGTVSLADADRSRQPDVPGGRVALGPAVDPRRCALTAAQFPEGRTLAADEADFTVSLLLAGEGT